MSEAIKLTPVKTGLTLSFLLVVLSGYYKLNGVMAGFSETFETFGTDLPFLTSIFSGYHAVIFSLLAIISIIAAVLVFSSDKARKFHKWAYVYTLCSPLICMLFLVLVMVAAYLPVFDTSSVAK